MQIALNEVKKQSLFYSNLRPMLGISLILLFLLCCLLEYALSSEIWGENFAYEQIIIRFVIYGAICLAIGFVAIYLEHLGQKRCSQEVEQFCDFLCEHIEHSKPFTQINTLRFSELDLIAQRINQVLARKQKSEYFGQFDVANAKYFCIQLDELSPSIRKDFYVAYLRIDNAESIFKILPSSKHDEFSSKVAKRLKTFVSQLSCAQLARISVGNYLIGFACNCDANTCAHNVYLGLKTCFDALLDSDYEIRFSLGIDQLQSATAASIANAQKACYHCNNNWAIYTAEMDYELALEQNICNELATAINNCQLQVQYQPKLNAKSQVMGAEALVRWRRNDGFFNTETFVRMAEKNGLIIKLERQVISKVCADMARLASMHLGTNVSINISATHFEQDDLVEFIQGQIDFYQLDAKRFELEITERQKLNEQGRKNIDRLNTLGFSISLDDFGKDYNSLNQLSELPVSVVKIDKVFVDGLNADAQNHDISVKVVRGIINMAKDLGKQVVAEGVETAEQIGILKQFGCDGYQGFYHYKSLDFDEFSKVLALNKQS